MPEDAFHEIQLNGKQLVFLFMAVTVVAVVIFLCGVLVGRGVRAERGYAEAAAASADVAPSPAVPAPAAGLAGSASAPTATAQEDLSYYERLDGEQPPPETVKDEPVGEAPPETVAPPANQPKTADAAEAARDGGPDATPASAATGEPAGSGWSVQVAAIKERGEAEAVARRLASKGYPAFVVAPGSGAPLFRVRVGKFKDRREAESVAARLQKDEQFKPWVVR